MNRDTIRFIATILYLTIGLWLVKGYAADQAAEKATRVAVAANIAQDYAHNVTACGIEASLKPSITAANSEAARSLAASKDKSLNKTSRNRQHQAYLDAKKKAEEQQKVLDFFVKIPPDFLCKNLPKKPPPFKE